MFSHFVVKGRKIDGFPKLKQLVHDQGKGNRFFCSRIPFLWSTIPKANRSFGILPLPTLNLKPVDWHTAHMNLGH